MYFVKEALRYGIRRLPIFHAVSSRDGLSDLRLSFYHLRYKKYNILINESKIRLISKPINIFAI